MTDMTRRTAIACLAGASLALAGIAPAAAQGWPEKPITLVVPFASGGTTDIIARTIGMKMGESLHQPVVVDNRPGARRHPRRGQRGARHAGRLHAAAGHRRAHHAPGIYKKLPYEFTRDLEPVGLVALTPNVLVVSPSLPVKSVAELIAYIKSHPGKVNYGSAGPGSTEHLSGELFRSMTGTDIVHVPYKGGAPMITDLIAGQIQMAVETSPSAAPHIRSGKLKALAVTTAKRSPAYPDVPTLDESGIKGYEVTTWYALMAPRGTPAAVLQRLGAELSRVLKQPDVSKRFEEQA